MKISMAWLASAGIVVFVAHPAPALAIGEKVDGAEAYGGKSAPCEVVAPRDAYKEFLGTWEGEFQSYDRSLKTFRPYHNRVTYAAKDCLRHTVTGDVLIIGRKTDTYPAFRGLPAKVTRGLIVTGLTQGDAARPFLRTLDEDGALDYELVFKNPSANMSIWRYRVTGSGEQPEMTFTILDGQDQTETARHKRLVTVTLQVGPDGHPLYQGVLAKGSHSRIATPKGAE